MTNIAVENIPEDDIIRVFDILKKAGLPNELNDDETYKNKFLRGLNEHAATFRVNKVLYTAHSTKSMNDLLFVPHPKEKIEIYFRDYGLTIFKKIRPYDQQGLDLRGTNKNYENPYEVCNTPEDVIRAFIESFGDDIKNI